MCLGSSKLLPSRKLLREKTFMLGASLVLSTMMIIPASADVFFGVEGSSSQGNTTNSKGSVISGSSTGETFGGEGATSLSFDTLNNQGEIDIAGYAGTQVNSPLLRLLSEGPSLTQASHAYVGAMTNYQYNGATAGTVTYDYTLTAVLTVPDDATTYAFIRARAGLITGAEEFETSVNNYFESNATVHDSYSFTFSDAATLNETGTLSFDADPGDVFQLVTSLQTWAGHTGAISDASNTFFGNLTTSSGTITSFNAVPEPGSFGLIMMAGVGTFLARRRRR